MQKIKSISLIGSILFYLSAGINYFLNPDFYYPLIPDYLPFPQLINILSGVFEITFTIGLTFQKTRKYASISIILMLIAFIPSHIYFIQIGSCVLGSLCISPWVSWIRLVIIHPIFMLWAWWHRK